MASKAPWVQRFGQRVTRFLLPFQRRLAETLPEWRRLQESEELYRLLVELAPDGIAIRTGGNFIYVNPAVVRLLGAKSADEVMGRPLQEFIDPEYREILNQQVQKTQQLRHDAQTAELKFIRLDGRRIDVELTSTVMFLRGKYTGLLIIRDISERKRAEGAVRRSEELYRTLARNFPKTSILVFDQELRCLLAEGTGLVEQGFLKVEMEGKTLWEILPKEEAEPLAAVYRTAFLGQETSFVTQYGEKSYFVHIVPVKNEYARIFATMAVARDITEEKQSEAQRIELAIEKERVAVLQRFVQDISHDLRTPLSVISTQLYLLQRTLDSPAERAKHFETLEAQVTRIGKILDDTLVMSRLDKANPDEYVFIPMDMNVIVPEVIAEVKALAEHRNQTLDFEPAASEMVVLVDEVQFKRVVRHLILNAVNFTPEHGKIHLRSGADEQNVILEVEDNGVGIGSLDVPHIFERFYRADVARRTDAGGSGLGLAIVKRIVDAHGGEIEVESTPGEGTLFRILLPKPNLPANEI
jgi:PAS domain S-box-containing protein